MLNLINQLRYLLTPQDKWKLLGLVALMTVSGAAEIAGIGLLMPVIAVFTKPELMEQNALLKFYAQTVGGGSQNRLLVVSCALVILVYLLKNILSFVVIRLQSGFSAGKEYELGMRLYRTYMQAPYALHLQKGHVELGVMIVRAREACNRVLLPLMVAASDVLVILMLAAVLMYSMPLVTLITMFLLGSNLFLAFFVLRKLNYRLGKEYADSQMEAECCSGDGFRAVREVKVCGKTDYFIARSAGVRQKAAYFYMMLFVVGQIPRLWLETAAILQLLLLFAGMVLLGVPQGTILLSFSLLITAMSRMLPACSRINYNAAVIRQSMAALDSVFEALKTAPEELGSGPELTFEKEITIEDLSFSYVPERPVLQHLDLTIPRLAGVAFTGTTGSGKSTLADLILGLLEPDSGAVKCDGRDIRENLVSWRAKIGYVPQFIFLLNGSIRSNVAFGVPEEEIDDEKVRACLRMAQLESYVDSLPAQLESCVGDNGIQLSGGQRQRIGIARALYRDPAILILDEATSALDNETEQAFVDALKYLHGKLTILMIAHRLSTIAHCDMHVSMPEGKIEKKSAAGKTVLFLLPLLAALCCSGCANRAVPPAPEKAAQTALPAERAFNAERAGRGRQLAQRYIDALNRSLETGDFAFLSKELPAKIDTLRAREIFDAMRKGLSRYGKLTECRFLTSLDCTFYMDHLWKYKFVKKSSDPRIPELVVEVLYRVRVIWPEKTPQIIKADFMFK